MLNSMIVKEAHRMTKEIKAEYLEVDYRFQYGLCLSYLLSVKKEEMKVMKGSEKQIKWAQDILMNMNEDVEKELNRWIAKGNEKAIADYTKVKSYADRISSCEDAAKIIYIASQLNGINETISAMNIKLRMKSGDIEEILKNL